MEFVPDQNQVTKILCCQCGLVIDKNALNTCIQCIQSKIDISEGIAKQGVLQFCNKCERYLQPPNSWMKAALESRQLLALCLKRIKGLNKVNLVDAGFIWTEPHSKRVKVKLVIQKEVNGAFLQQSAVIEFTVLNQICDDCQRVEAKDYWNAVVQVRQHVEHKKTFYFIEQLILKLKMHENTVSIKQVHGGIDFFYSCQQDARKMVDFLESVIPCRYGTSKKLISQDIQSNTYNYKFNFSLEIVPICKDNIVCLPEKLSKDNGGIGPICLVTKITKMINLIDPTTLKTLEIDATTYWRYPFLTVCSPKQYREYLVMEIDVLKYHERTHVFGRESKKHELADVWVMKAKDIGVSEQQYHAKTHLGHLLSEGDIALGFDLANANVNDDNLDKLKSEDIPDVILIKKIYGDEQNRHKKRKWKLNRLKIDKEESIATSEDRDYMDFLQDVEEDKDFRANINIYKDHKKIKNAQEATDGQAVNPQNEISLEEMLDDLDINDNMES